MFSARSITSLKSFLIFFPFLFASTWSMAQKPIAVLDFNCGNQHMSFTDFLLGINQENPQDTCQRIQNIVMDKLYEDDRVTVVVPETSPAVAAERELQKDEDFLEGYVVDQWAQQGAEYLLTGQIRTGRQSIVLQIHRLEDRKVVAQQVQSFKVGLGAPLSEQRSLVEQGLQLLLTDFLRAKIPIVKVLNGSSSKARRVLVAGGTSQGFRTHQQLAVVVDGKTVGSLVVEVVESEFFSRCRVMDGGREIAVAINEGLEVEIQILRK